MKPYRAWATVLTPNMHSKPFRLTRLRLATWYTSVMTLILILSGIAIDRLLVHARWLHLDGEMQRLASTLENEVETGLVQSGQIDPSFIRPQPEDELAQLLLIELCKQNVSCPPAIREKVDRLDVNQTVDDWGSREYCVRFLDPNKNQILTMALPYFNSECHQEGFWKQGHYWQGKHYHKASYPLHTKTRQDWGLMQIAQPLDDLDSYLVWIEIGLGGVVVLAIGLVGCSSWWLAGLVIQPMRQSYEQMQQFTADAAHELRTPVAAMRAMVQTALRAEDLSAQEAQETLQIVNRQSYRLSSLVQDLLTLCQIDQQTAVAPFTLCCLDIIVKERVEELMALAMANDVTLAVELHSSPLYMVGSADQIGRAVANLISNAIQYTPLGGNVLVKLTSEHGQALIQVIDTGIGISPTDQARIFDRFYRVNQERSRHRGSSGLGLAITQVLVQSHGGTVQVQSELGKGSTFSLRLPLLAQQSVDRYKISSPN